MKVFISYADADNNKVRAFAGALEKNRPTIEPIIIATRKEPGRPLAQKVADGIRESDFFVPILTGKSMDTQWINQEIGFAQGIEKPIIPIVEAGIMSKLKGFVHMQNDLPFHFTASTNPRSEAGAFRTAYLHLIRYLIDQMREALTSTISPQRVRSGETYTTRATFKGTIENGFFDNYVEHLDSDFRKWNWDRETIPAEGGRSTPSNTAPGTLNGYVDITREYTWPTRGWPPGRYKIHVRVYTHPVPGETRRYPVAENVHDFEVY